jgi:hypothetical protein
LLALFLLFAASNSEVEAQGQSECVTCHETETPGIVDQWLQSKMVINDCAVCHGSEHVTDTDYDKAKLPTPDTCAMCHFQRVSQFRDGKHSLAWAAMPAWGHLPVAVQGPAGFKGCSGCHKIGEKSAEAIAEPEFRYGTASCDSCHTRHTFSRAEALDPHACEMCHQGFDHPQWEMWSTAKHGTIWLVEGDTGRAPTCQDCHMSDSNHAVITAWGFLGLRVPEADEEWWADRVVILQALGVLDNAGNPTPRLDLVANAKVARLTAEEFNAERAKMEVICQECHSEIFVSEQMAVSDGVLKEADALMAEAITIVKALYDDGILDVPEGWDFAPDLLQFFSAQSDIEQELFTMFLEYRNRAFMGAFHNNPDYMWWYGYAMMQDSLQTIKDEAVSIRAEDGLQGPPGPQGPAGPEGGVTFAIVALVIAAVALVATTIFILRRRGS